MKTNKISIIGLVTALAIVVLVGIDQLTKYFVVTNLKPIGQKMLIPGFIQLNYVENTGAMMGMLGGRTTLMIILAFIVLAVLFALIITKKIRFGFLYCCIIAIASGGIGNIIDRVARGYVVDFFEFLFVDFYVFNFADCLITVGAFLIVFYEIYDIIKEQKAKKVEKNG